MAPYSVLLSKERSEKLASGDAVYIKNRWWFSLLVVVAAVSLVFLLAAVAHAFMIR